MSLFTSPAELKDMLKAWLIISLAFAIVLSGGFTGILSLKFLLQLVIALLAVGSGFLFHELGHKLLAQRYGFFAEFKAFDNMLFIALIMSLFGFVFAAPGAVMIHGSLSKKQNGKISLAGPLINLILAAIFLSMFFLVSIDLLRVILFPAFIINSWLALFNMIPVWNFDGSKILEWNKIIYTITIIISIVFVAFGFYASNL